MSLTMDASSEIDEQQQYWYQLQALIHYEPDDERLWHGSSIHEVSWCDEETTAVDFDDDDDALDDMMSSDPVLDRMLEELDDGDMDLLAEKRKFESARIQGGASNKRPRTVCDATPLTVTPPTHPMQRSLWSSGAAASKLSTQLSWKAATAADQVDMTATTGVTSFKKSLSKKKFGSESDLTTLAASMSPKYLRTRSLRQSFQSTDLLLARALNEVANFGSESDDDDDDDDCNANLDRPDGIVI